MAQFDNLPIEVVALIMKCVHQHHSGHKHSCRVKKQLVRYVTVNKQFYAFFSAKVWSDPILLVESHADQFLTSMTASHPSVGRHVAQFKYVFPRSDRMLIRILDYMKHLTTLEIANASLLTDRSIQQLPHSCPKLGQLVLSRALITERSLHAVANQCQQLTGLQLHDCPALTSDLFSALVCSSSLKVLDIKVAPLTKIDWLHPTTITRDDDDDDDARIAHVVKITARLSQLVDVSLTGAPAAFMRHLLATLGSTRIMAKTVFQPEAAAIPCTWPRLTRLVLGDFDGTVGNAQLGPLIQCRPELVKLGFHDTRMTDITLDAIAQSLPRIQALDLPSNRRLSSRGVRRLVRRCSRLTQVDLYNCKLRRYEFPEVDFHGRYLEVLNRHAINDIRFCANSDPGEPEDWDDDDSYDSYDGNTNHLQDILAYINGDYRHHYHTSEEERNTSDEE